MECIFCKIINNEISSYTIYEDEIVKCFLDINPDSVGHMLIVPKSHFNDLYDIDSYTYNHIFEVSKKMGLLLKEKLNTDGLTLIQNNGDIQIVKHFHLHLKPYYKNNNEISVKEVYDILTRV